MSLKDYEDGTTLFASDVNAFTGEHITLIGLNTIKYVINGGTNLNNANLNSFCEAYTDANGQVNTVDTVNSTATFDTNKYKSLLLTGANVYFVIIEATSINISAFTINDCHVLTHVDGGKWIVYANQVSVALSKAKVIKTLFYNEGGSASPGVITTVTGLTSIKTSDSDDVGKRGHYAYNYMWASDGEHPLVTITGTFDTTTSNVVNSWSKVRVKTGRDDGLDASCEAVWEMPSGTILNRVYDPDNVTSPIAVDEVGTDTSADNKTNPATCQLDNDADSSGADPTWTSTAYTRALILTKGGIDWVIYINNHNTYDTVLNQVMIDYTTEYSIPAFTDGSSEDLSGFKTDVVHTLPTSTFGSAITNAIGTALIETFETGNSIQYKLSNTSDDSDWLETNSVQSFTAFTSEPTTLTVRLLPIEAQTDGYPAIRGFWVRAT